MLEIACVSLIKLERAHVAPHIVDECVSQIGSSLLINSHLDVGNDGRIDIKNRQCMYTSSVPLACAGQNGSHQLASAQERFEMGYGAPLQSMEAVEMFGKVLPILRSLNFITSARKTPGARVQPARSRNNTIDGLKMVRA